MLSFDRKVAINLHFDFLIPIPDTTDVFNAKSVITGVYKSILSKENFKKYVMKNSPC